MRLSLDVIIPCYNAATTLETAVKSALLQAEVQNVWLVDDASTDNTRDVM
ncbi:glycosyltransferase, partial [Neisseria weixii]